MKYRLTYCPPQMQQMHLQGELPVAASATADTPGAFGRDAGDGGMFHGLDINAELPW